MPGDETELALYRIRLDHWRSRGRQPACRRATILKSRKRSTTSHMDPVARLGIRGASWSAH